MGKQPILNSEFYDDVTKKIRSGISSINDMANEMNSLHRQIQSGNYAGEKLHEMISRYDSLRTAIPRERKHQLDIIKECCNEFTEQLRREDDLNPADIKDGDLKLLTCGVRLSDRDIRAMLERNSNNRTMTQIIIRTLKEDSRRDIDLGLHYTGNKDLISNVGIIPDLAKTVFKYDDGIEGSAGHVYSRVLGEGSTMADIFSPEND